MIWVKFNTAVDAVSAAKAQLKALVVGTPTFAAEVKVLKVPIEPESPTFAVTGKVIGPAGTEYELAPVKPTRSNAGLTRVVDVVGASTCEVDVAPTVTVIEPEVVLVLDNAAAPSNVTLLMALEASVPEPVTVPVLPPAVRVPLTVKGKVLVSLKSFV